MRPIYISTKEVIEEINYAPLALFHIPRLTRKSYVETDNMFLCLRVYYKEKNRLQYKWFLSVFDK